MRKGEIVEMLIKGQVTKVAIIELPYDHADNEILKSNYQLSCGWVEIEEAKTLLAQFIQNSLKHKQLWKQANRLHPDTEYFDDDEAWLDNYQDESILSFTMQTIELLSAHDKRGKQAICCQGTIQNGKITWKGENDSSSNGTDNLVKKSEPALNMPAEMRNLCQCCTQALQKNGFLDWVNQVSNL